jgi:hypothetical protein
VVKLNIGSALILKMTGTNEEVAIDNIGQEIERIVGQRTIPVIFNIYTPDDMSADFMHVLQSYLENDCYVVALNNGETTDHAIAVNSEGALVVNVAGLVCQGSMEVASMSQDEIASLDDPLRVSIDRIKANWKSKKRVFKDDTPGYDCVGIALQSILECCYMEADIEMVILELNRPGDRDLMKEELTEEDLQEIIRRLSAAGMKVCPGEPKEVRYKYVCKCGLKVPIEDTAKHSLVGLVCDNYRDNREDWETITLHF